MRKISTYSADLFALLFAESTDQRSVDGVLITGILTQPIFARPVSSKTAKDLEIYRVLEYFAIKPSDLRRGLYIVALNKVATLTEISI